MYPPISATAAKHRTPNKNNVVHKRLDVQSRSNEKKNPITKNPMACNHFRPTVSVKMAVTRIAEIK